MIKSTFALLDVLGFRRCANLRKAIKSERVRVVIYGELDERPHGNWDGTSQEFTVHVTGVEVLSTEVRKVEAA